jgi:Uma2 family endonuclease
MSMALPTYYTAEMVRQMPDDGNRYETVHGELLVTPSPRPLHQLVLARLQLAIGKYLEREPIGVLLSSPADISWGPDVLVQPDLFVVPLVEARTLDWGRMQHLLLALEVLSPSSMRADRFAKRRLYQEVGIPLYWVIDADEQVAEAWTPDMTFPSFERQRLAWHPEGASEPLTISLPELFRPF